MTSIRVVFISLLIAAFPPAWGQPCNCSAQYSYGLVCGNPAAPGSHLYALEYSITCACPLS
jgi:hypothetical protein